MDKTDLTIRQWSEEEFFHNREKWQQLLSGSSADKLFLSWDWMAEWWSIWGVNSTLRLCIYAAYDQGGALAGIAPLYLCTDTVLKGTLSVKRLQFIGTRYKGSSGIRAENLEFIARNRERQAITSALLYHIHTDNSWDELILSDLIVNDCTYDAVNKNIYNYYPRITRSERSFLVDCTGSFDTYLAGLGKNTRLKFYNRRKLLETYGNVSIDYVSHKNINEVFETMNDFHKKRWSSLAFREPHEQILRKVLDIFEPVNGATFSSILKVNGKPLSVLMNLFANKMIYNIQLGYMEDFDRKISLGTLHLGYAIEDAFRNDNVDSFNLLAGRGKNTEYKERIARPYATLESLQMVRNSLLKSLYFVNDQIVQRFKGA